MRDARSAWGLLHRFSRVGIVRRLRALAGRYVDAHFAIRLNAEPLRGPDGARLGYLEETVFERNRVTLRGWSVAGSVTIEHGPQSVTIQPSIERSDVAQHLGCHAMVGFAAALPRANAPLLLRLHGADVGAPRVVSPPTPAQVARAERRLRLRMAADLARVAPRALRQAATGGAWRATLKQGLRLGQHASSAVLDGKVLAARRDVRSMPLPAGMTIVLPVYNAAELLPETLDRVLRHTDVPWRMVLVDDASPDSRVAPLLADWAASARASGHHVELLRQPANRGFVHSANLGLRVAERWADPVVLLNADARVPDAWASRLLAPMHPASEVASVTPLSNDAEVFCAPVICVPVSLAPGQADAIDAAIRDLPPDPAVSVPTGVGFCMALSPDFLRRVPQLDEAFGRGYGEEVDWCRKTASLGGRHVAAANLFVEHVGGASFGSEEKQRLRRANARIISSRYPGYDAEVQAFIRSDPLVTYRLAAALAHAESAGPGDVPVFIAHALGGGAELALQRQVARSSAAVVLRFGGTHRCRIEVHTPAGLTTAATNDLALVERLVRRMTRRRIVYSCAVGAQDAIGIPPFLLRIAEGRALEVLFHDYFPISPSYTLLGSDGVYRGVPGPGCTDPAHDYLTAEGRRVRLGEWQHAWGAVIARAARLTVFSDASAAIVAQAYPAAAPRLRVSPHPPLAPPLHCADMRRGETVIGVLGNIGAHKGAAIVSALSERLRGSRDTRLVLLGRIDPAFPLAPGVTEHGPYLPEEIASLVARHGITVFLIPSIWPETFSFTTHEALATQLPVITFDLGAQGAAAANARNGHVIALPPPGEAGRAPCLEMPIERIVALARDVSAPAHPAATGPARKTKREYAL